MALGPVRDASSRAGSPPAGDAVDPDALARAIQTYLGDHPAAAVLEDGRVIFDMRAARYTISDSHGRCLLQLWSEDRNLIRSVVGVQERAEYLRVLTRKLGSTSPQALEFVPTSDRRTPTARDQARRGHVILAERVLSRNFPGWKVEGLRSAMDLEHSFGPAYVRGRLVRGTEEHAIVTVGTAESSSTIDGALTLGLLWLDYCRTRGNARRNCGALKLVVPEGAWRITAERMAWLNHALARFELYALDERTEELRAVDFRDIGNIESRLVQAFSRKATIESCQAGIQRVLELLPANGRNRVELLAQSAAEVALLLHGLAFARIRVGLAAGSFARELEIAIGAGAQETPLTPATEAFCRQMLERLVASRHPDGSYGDPLYRFQPERWLEARVRAHLGTILPGADPGLVYSQVPALSSKDRGMLDLLALDRDHRLVVIELKADEDLHLPLQTLDYWIRVRSLHSDRQPAPSGRTLSAFECMGYFPGQEISTLSPRVLLAAPALRIHPANEPVLRYLSPEIQWELLGVTEDWRRDFKVVFRKHSGNKDLES